MQDKKTDIPWRKYVTKFSVFSVDYSQLGLSKCLLNDSVPEVV